MDGDDHLNNRIEVVLNCCEKEEHILHKRLSSLMNILWVIPGVDSGVLTEIEDIYIQKGIVYCNYAYRKGLEDGKAKK